MRILVLGENGMLGNAVTKYISQTPQHTTETIKGRFPETVFIDQLAELSDIDAIVNCIGAIPQKQPQAAEYQLCNIDLPVYLEKLGIKIIHPSTDCEFAGFSDPLKRYSKHSPRDATDAYGRSKAAASEMIETSFSNTKIIRTSIIGHELKTSLSLLDWFLSQAAPVNGYTTHFWNGITTLEWAKHCLRIIENWENAPRLTQLATEPGVSKFELLSIAKEVYSKTIKISPFATTNIVNKCLESDFALPSLKNQLNELRSFYSR